MTKRFDAGETDYKALWISLAAEYGYEVTDDEIDECIDATITELPEEELGKLSGGTTPVTPSIVATVIGASVISGLFTKRILD